MSYIDGYEAFDGSVKINYIPESTLPQLTAEFYRSPSNKAVQTEESKKKKKEEEKKPKVENKSAVMTPRTPEISFVKPDEPKSLNLNFPAKKEINSIIKTLNDDQKTVLFLSGTEYSLVNPTKT